MQHSSLQQKEARRWLAEFSGEFLGIDGTTRMGKTSHYGPLRVQRPFFPEGKECLHLYLLHPPGGLVGGDRLSINLFAKTDAHVLMTTPSAGKLYRNISGLSQGQEVCIEVGDNAIVEYLPQDNIIFDGADGLLNTRVNLSDTGTFIGWEITSLGRPASDDFFNSGQLQQSLLLSRNGTPLFSDRVLLNANDAFLNSKAGFQGHTVFGTFIISTDITAIIDMDALLRWQEQSNQQLACGHIAITQKPGVFIARILTDKAEQARTIFEELWCRLRPAVIQRDACPPRIWRT